MVVNFIKNVFSSLESKINDNTVVCVKSTIHPAAIDDVFNDLSLNYDDLVFNPEFLREGSAFEDFFQTDRIILGSNNKQNSELIAKLYDGIDTEILFMDPVSSQLVKYLSNAYLPMRLSFVNEASRLIDALNANQKDVLNGVGLDSRIGQEYFRPSPGWGGSCFPKDVKELQSLSHLSNLNLSLINSINNVHIMLITGNLDLRPKANIIPIGKANAIPVQPRTSVTRRPPHLLVETSVKPNPPLSKK